LRLRREFATKYITVSLLECENYLGEVMDPDHLPGTPTNIDMKSVSFQGTCIRLDEYLGQESDLIFKS
jgi:hypothetical protein